MRLCVSTSEKHQQPTPAQTALFIMGIVLVVLISWTVARSEGVQAERRASLPHQHVEAAKTVARRACSGLEPAAAFDCIFERVEESDETARGEADLDAQQQMALWALLMVIVSALTAAIAAAALWYVKATLNETRALTVEAQKTTSAAELSLQIAQKVGAAELRPWITIDAAVTKTEPRGRGIAVDYQVTFDNIGKTVAKQLRIVSRHYFLGGKAIDPIRLFYSEAESLAPHTDRALIPGERVTLPGSHMQSLDTMPWEGERNRYVYSVVLATVFYKSELDDIWHRTDRSFTFGVPGDDLFDHRYLREDRLQCDPDLIVSSPFIAGETT